MPLEAIPADTTLEAARVQVGVFRRMLPSRRLELACQMSNTLRQVVVSGVRSRHPEYTESQVRLAASRLALGDLLFRQVHPDLDIEV